MAKIDQKRVLTVENEYWNRFVSKIAVGVFRTGDNGCKPSEIDAGCWKRVETDTNDCLWFENGYWLSRWPLWWLWSLFTISVCSSWTLSLFLLALNTWFVSLSVMYLLYEFGRCQKRQAVAG